MADVLAQARKEVKDRRVAIDRQRWQCAMTPELLRLVQSSRAEEALDTLISNLFDPEARDCAKGWTGAVRRCAPEVLKQETD